MTIETSSSLSASTDAPPATTEPTDADLLRQLWRLTLKTLIAELQSGEAKASGLAVARSFLESNNVSLQSINTLEGRGGAAAALGPLLKNLPSFND